MADSPTDKRHHMAAGMVDAADMNTFRIDTGRQLGLHAQLASAPLEEGYDVLLECSGAPATLSTGLRAMARTGRVLLVGINVPLVQGRELTITGTFRYANTFPLALDLISSGAVDVASVITHHFDIDHTADALTLAVREPNSSKAISGSRKGDDFRSDVTAASLGDLGRRVGPCRGHRHGAAEAVQGARARTRRVAGWSS